MGKGAKSKRVKRLGSAKLAYYMEKIGNKLIEEHHKMQSDKQYSDQMLRPTPPNAFVNPEDPSAMFPQKKHFVGLDFRSSAVDYAKYVGSHNRRKLKRSKYATKIIDPELEQIEEEQKNTEKEKELEKEIDNLKFGNLNIDSQKKKIVPISVKSRKIKKRNKGRSKSYKITHFS